MKLDILAIGAHPDDVELCAAGTLYLHMQRGKKCGILDLTRGELGTRGNAETRMMEAEKATAILGISVRENLGIEDGFFQHTKENQLASAGIIRKYQPEIVLCNAIRDRHPDHGRASKLVSDAIFLAGLSKVNTIGKEERWKVKAVYHYIQDRYIIPDLAIDITSVWDKKMEAVMAYSSQFYNPDSTEPDTAISTKDFLDFLVSRSMDFGRPLGVRYAEAFTVERTIGTTDLFQLI